MKPTFGQHITLLLAPLVGHHTLGFSVKVYSYLTYSSLSLAQGALNDLETVCFYGTLQKLLPYINVVSWVIYH